MKKQKLPSRATGRLLVRSRALCAGLAIALTQMTSVAMAFDNFTIEDIRIDGLERIANGTVLTYLPVERGDAIDSNRAASALRALYKTGFFDDVTLSRDGNILVIAVKERPAISKVNLVGNKDIKEPDLRKALAGIGLSEGEVYNKLIIDKVQQELTKQYYNRGKYNVKVTPKVKTLDRNRVEVTINVGEGKAAKIRHINIVGNKIFTDQEIIEAFESKTTNWLSWYKRDDQYAKEKIQGDLEKLREFYLDRGYVDMEIESTQVSISPDRSNIYITANVTEGEIYKVSGAKLTGTFIVGQDALQPLIFTQPGDTFSRKRLEQTSDAIKAVLSNVGYAFAEVQQLPEIDRDKREVALTFFVNPGKRVYVRRINFKGNLKTQDEVLRREMRQFEGGWFSQAQVDRSKIRLQRLGFFQEVKIETPKVAGADDQVDIEVTVEERQSGNFQFGFGYSAFQGLVTNLSLQQENFLGRGNRVGFAVSNNRYNRRFDFSFFDPYWTDDGISRGYNLSFREQDYANSGLASFLSNVIDFSTVYSFPITETDRVNFQIGVDQNKIGVGRLTGFSPDEYFNFVRGSNGNVFCPPPEQRTRIDPGPPETTITESFQPEICKGTYQALRVQSGWARDSRNRFFVPTAGSYARLGVEATLPLSDLRYYKLSGQYQKFIPLGYNFVFMTNSEVNYGGTYGSTKDFPFYENYYNGGVRSVRGFRDNTLGPRLGLIDATTPPNPDDIRNALPAGGAFSLNQTFELMFPTPFAKDAESVRLAAFLDAGQVYKDFDSFDAADLRYSAGISVQWQSPVAPIIINFAYPLNDKPGDEVERLQFSFFNNL